MDKKEVTLAVIDAVEKYPLLYSGESHFNARRADHVQAWNEVAAEVGQGVNATDCKQRWNVLRRNHTKFLRTGRNTIKIPGIHERLSFLNSWIKSNKDKEAKRSQLRSLAFNIELVKLVEQHPWLYNDQPRSTAEDEEAWEQIASIMSDDVSVTSEDMRTQWLSLRRIYVQFMQDSPQDSPQRIESYMHFLIPHLKFPIKTNFVPKSAECSDLTTESETTRVEDYDHLGYDPGDQDAAFLLSILPHLKAMTGHQRRKFKVCAVTLSADMLSDFN